MKMPGISRELLNLLLSIGKSQHPLEFLAILEERDNVLAELDLVPGTVSGAESASFSLDMLPLGTRIAGSAHSHPNGVLEPSTADLRFFPSVGRYHIIVGPPYGPRDWRCFTAGGSPCTLEVIG
ncbi:MAG: proteasome protein [Methanomicrobiales archaeon]|nr:proteasome protein [Methanomicrobiales archaeon]